MSEYNFMDEPKIMVVKPGSLSDTGKEQLEDLGVVVIEAENPADLRLMSLESILPTGELLECALNAITSAESNTRNTMYRLFGWQIVKRLQDARPAQTEESEQ